MIDATHDLPILRQAQLLALGRSTVYHQPQPTSDADLALMRRIEELHLEHPFAGSRMLRDLLIREGVAVGRKHVATLIRRMGIEALYQQPRNSGRHREHPVFPYRLRGLAIDRPNHVWAMDTTCIPMRRGFVYLTVVFDRASRRVPAWRMSISLTADAAVDCACVGSASCVHRSRCACRCFRLP
jgi:putative transposase